MNFDKEHMKDIAETLQTYCNRKTVCARSRCAFRTKDGCLIKGYPFEWKLERKEKEDDSN